MPNIPTEHLPNGFNCDGTGTIRCSVCNGEGEKRVECIECDSTGHVEE